MAVSVTARVVHLAINTVIYGLATSVILVLVYFVQNEIHRRSKRIKNLPGPRGWPVAGNLLQLRNTVHAETYRLWAQKHGPVFQVQLGNSTVVTINSAAAAKELLIGQAHAMNSRPQFYVFHKQVTQKAVLSIGTSPWDESCKKRRKVAATALNRSRVEQYGGILNLESREFLRGLLELGQDGKTAVDFRSPVKLFSVNLSLALNYGTRVESLEKITDGNVMHEVLYVEDQISSFRDTGKNYANYLPFLRYWEPVKQIIGQSNRSKDFAADIGRRRLEYNRVLLNKLEDEVRRDVDKPCIQGAVLRDPASSDLTREELISVSLSMMAGAQSNQPTMIWATLVLAHRQDVQEKAYTAICDAGVLDLPSDAYANTKIPYIDAFTKEVGRYFSVLKLALPKATLADVVWRGATIPANTTVFLNSWACNRDLEVFTDPNTFAPERWLPGGTSQEHAHQYAWGMGGRMCVASHLAHRALYTVFLHLIAKFHVLPPDETSGHVIDPLKDLRDPEYFIGEPRDFMAKLVPRDGREKLVAWIGEGEGR